jgi:hypothetical protein
MPRAFVAVVLLLALGSACQAPAAALQDRTTQQVTDFFTSGPKVGLDPDVGLYRYSGMAETWEHVATIHSMGDDMQMCQDLVAALKKMPEHIRPFTCRVLNK